MGKTIKQKNGSQIVKNNYCTFVLENFVIAYGIEL